MNTYWLTNGTVRSHGLVTFNALWGEAVERLKVQEVAPTMVQLIIYFLGLPFVKVIGAGSIGSGVDDQRGIRTQFDERLGENDRYCTGIRGVSKNFPVQVSDSTILIGAAIKSIDA
jgi:hypothetical protein